MTKYTFKFRLLCKRCNSYRHTEIDRDGYHMTLRCKHCGNEASRIDETNEPNEWDGLLEQP